MKILGLGLLCGCLLTSGCTRQEVNKVSVFEYDSTDDAGAVALKTAGNLVPWVGGAAIYGLAFAAYLVSGGGQNSVSGTISSRGAVSVTR